jgi:hypothetical protein
MKTKQQLTEIKRLQKIAGIVLENENDMLSSNLEIFNITDEDIKYMSNPEIISALNQIGAALKVVRDVYSNTEMQQQEPAFEPVPGFLQSAMGQIKSAIDAINKRSGE